MVTRNIRLFLLHVHLDLLQISVILVRGDLEAELDGLLGDERASKYLTVRAIVRDTVREQSRRIVDILVCVLFIDLVALDLVWVIFAAQSANAARLSASFT